jgi:hypothetical protein
MVRAVLERGPAIETLKSALRQSKSAVIVAQGAAGVGSRSGTSPRRKRFAAAVQSEAANAHGCPSFGDRRAGLRWRASPWQWRSRPPPIIDALLAEFRQTLENHLSTSDSLRAP